MVGIIGTALLQRTSYYKKLCHLNFIPSKSLNRFLCIKQFKWIVKNSFFRFLNQSLKVEGQHTDLVSLRLQMTNAEIGHWIGFLFVAVFAVYQCYNKSPIFGLAMMLPNVILNAYPSLLQQENKRRLDKLIDRIAKYNDPQLGD
ncbi:MAG: hypothetical protein MUC83_06440 [Pirellula sp.]|jgi:hypothetical protein|nr:hypothetical protein [Pirellula sp.]